MRVDFIKMHGLGNDFVVLDGRETALPAMTQSVAHALADRNTGIGCDQLIVLAASDMADFRMQIFNPDGSEVEACGNATRAVTLLNGADVSIETSGGLLHGRLTQAGICVDMGVPRFGWEDIPLAYPVDTLHMPMGWEGLERPSAVNVGNPHVVFFVADNDVVRLDQLGPVIEQDEIFPERVNVNVATVESRQEMRLRVWERGAGLTRACGTGACASAVAGMRLGLLDRQVDVHLPGGTLHIGWGADDRITMTGPATESFRGSFEWKDYA